MMSTKKYVLQMVPDTIDHRDKVCPMFHLSNQSSVCEEGSIAFPCLVTFQGDCAVVTASTCGS